MRGSHSKYISMVNAVSPVWYVKQSADVWLTILPLEFNTIAGKFYVPRDTRTDLFTAVPDTGYTRFHKAAVLHDEMRKDPKVSRYVADVCFMLEMIAAVKDIRSILMTTDCPQQVIDRECVRLCRIAALYMLGVSGWLGTLYIKLDKYF